MPGRRGLLRDDLDPRQALSGQLGPGPNNDHVSSPVGKHGGDPAVPQLGGVISMHERDDLVEVSLAVFKAGGLGADHVPVSRDVDDRSQRRHIMITYVTAQRNQWSLRSNSSESVEIAVARWHRQRKHTRVVW